ncbi:MAG: PAS domain S-box protein [Nitrospirae bacterium]|nr:PAS domain S-box protein [Nitrospirota bacterium]
MAIVLTLLALLAGTFAFRYLETAMENRTGQALASTAATVAGKMDIQFVERAGDLRILSQAEALRTGNQALITKHLKNLLASYPIYFWAGWIDRDDNLLVATTPLPPGQKLDLQAELALIHRGAPIIIRAPQQKQDSQSERSGITFLGRVEDEQGQLLGTLVTRMGFSNFEETYRRDITIFEQQWGGGTKVELQLFEPSGRALIDSLLQEQGRLTLQDLTTASATASQLKAEGFVKEQHARRHIDVLTGYARTKGLAQGEGQGWTVLLRIDETAALAPIRAILRNVTGAILLILAPLLGLLLLSLRYLHRAKAASIRDLSRAEHAEKSLQLEQQQQALTSYLRAILDAATEISIIATDQEGLITTFNAGAERLLGYSAEEMVGKKTPASFHVESEIAAHGAKLSERYDRPIHGFQAFIEEALQGNTEQREWTYVRKNGEHLTVHLTVTALHDETGNISGYLGIATNITERKRTDAIILEREAQLRAIVDHAVDGIVVIDGRGTIESFNPAAERIFGYDASAVLGQNVKLLMPSPYHEEHDGYLSAYLRTGQAKIIGTGREVVGRRKDGSTFPLDLGVSEIQLDNRRLFTGIIRDITERKQTEASLQEQIQLSLLAAEINSILVKSSTLPVMLQQCAATMIRHLDAAFTRIWLISPSDLCGDCHKAAACTNRTECLHLTASAGLSENLNGEYRRVPLGALKIGKIAQGWGAMTTNDVLSEDRLPNKSWLTEQGLQAFAGYPLTVGTHVVGVMAVFSRHRLSEQTLKSLERIAQVISLGVERKRAEEDRQSTLTLLTNVMNNTPDFIFVKDQNLRTILCNNVFAQAIGKTPEEMQGHTDIENGWDPELVHGNPSKGVRGFEMDDREALSGKIVHNLTDPANVGDTIRIFDTFKVPLRNGAGEIIGLLGISRDITERTQAQEELAAARDQALAATRAKGEFLASMSHEIRTPMNAIIGMAELLSDTPLNGHQAEYVRRLGRASHTLLTLINSILDLSKIEAGFLELESVPFNVVELTERVSEISATQAQGKLLELICFVSPDVPPNLIGDPTRLQQVLINLLGNAVKFTERGEICLHIEPDPDDPTAGALRFTVTDTGIGIPADKIAHIFESFTQVDASTTRKYGGTGLGLAISKKLVELMGGSLTLRSTLGQGSTFSFTSRFAVALISQTPATTLSLTGQRILAIDDNSTNLMLLRETLSHYGATIIEASDGVQALAILKALQTSNQLPQLIITDGHMPNMDGVQLIREIQADPAIASLPIIMLASDARIGNSATAKQLRITALISKPVSRAALLKQVARALGHHAINTKTTASSAAPSPWMTQPPTRPALDQEKRLATLRVLTADDNADNQFLIQSYLSDMVRTLDLANDGQQAVDRFKAGTYDIVLMDMQMPVMDGYTATQTIRAWEQTLGRMPTPILALTAHALQGDAQRTLDAGCTAHLAKPVLREDLLAALQTYTSTSQPAITPIPAAPTQATNPALRHMIPGYLARRREDLETCRQLLTDKDFPSISALMHKMAGTGGGYGFPQLTNVARQVEQAALQQDPAAIQRHLDTLAQVLAEIGDGTAQP